MKDIDIAKNRLLQDDLTLVVVRDGEVIYESRDRGIKALVQIITENPDLLQNSSLADTVTGKAAGMIYAEGNVKEVYSRLLSKSAMDVLEKHHISYLYDNITERIQNQTKTDLCPMEKIALHSDNVEQLLYGVNSFFKSKFGKVD